MKISHFINSQNLKHKCCALCNPLDIVILHHFKTFFFYIVEFSEEKGRLPTVAHFRNFFGVQSCRCVYHTEGREAMCLYIVLINSRVMLGIFCYNIFCVLFPIRNDSRIATIKCREDETLLTLDEVQHVNYCLTL